MYCFYFLLLLASTFSTINNAVHAQAKRSVNNTFKVIGYYYYVPTGPAAADLNLEGLTHINYSFAIPQKEGYGLEPIKHSENLHKMVAIAHASGKKVFVSLGGWNLGDGGGNDSRFHKLAENPEGRKTFVQDVMQLVATYHLDGIDMDWEYPDADASSDHFLLLMQLLRQALDQHGKELTVAVVSYDGRLGSNGKVSSALGIKKEVLQLVDWVNIMAYDDENGKPFPNPHSTFALAEKCLNYWIKERGLPAEKAVLGLPYYAKPGYISYKKLLEQGADPAKDVFDKVFYNGTETIKAKTKLALQSGCGGVMMWEISQDVKGQHSLTRAINEAINH